MKSIIVGTAGHIDHGKTALVKALTGIDADRLEEEKRRGITIDLGFAHLELPAPDGQQLRFGFIDVPGHERFVRNMLAGVGGIDLVLLVIAADEGIKPQTREHFDICRLLGIGHGIAVLTKADLVDPDMLEVVRLELEDFLRGSFLEGAPIVPVSSLRQSGFDELKRALVRTAEQVSSRDASAIARLPIDRVFTMKGFGTVTTGTLIAGSIHREAELELFPWRRRVRVRGVEVHGRPADYATAGERTALNLSGIDRNELERGMVLAPPGLLETSSTVDVRLSLLPSANPLKTGSRIRLHALTSELIATVRLYESKRLEPGQEGFAQLHLGAPLLLVPGDRFILRQLSPAVTIGGGVLLDAFPLRKVPVTSRLEFLRLFDAGDLGRVVIGRIRRRGSQGITIPQLIAEHGLSQRLLEGALKNSQRENNIVRSGDLLIDAGAVVDLTRQLVALVADFHAKNPLVAGISKESLREQARLGERAFEAVLASGIRQGQLAIRGELVHLPGRGVVMKDEEAESRKTIEQSFASAGLKVPTLKEVLATLKIDKDRAQKIMTLLLRDKTLVKVSDDLVFHRNALDDLRKNIASLKQRSQKIDVAGFKDLTGVSRKYAIPLLEYLDRERVTRRVGDERVIL
jgi:selenocysteine-specific elongation factor